MLIDFYFQSRATSKKLDNRIKQSIQTEEKKTHTQNTQQSNGDNTRHTSSNNPIIWICVKSAESSNVMIFLWWIDLSIYGRKYFICKRVRVRVLIYALTLNLLDSKSGRKKSHFFLNLYIYTHEHELVNGTFFHSKHLCCINTLHSLGKIFMESDWKARFFVLFLRSCANDVLS